MAAPKPVNTAVIGAGEISGIYLHNMTQTFSILNVIGISDRIESRAESRAREFGIRKMTNEEILSNPDIEIVVNLTNPQSHYTVSKQALNAGKNVYSEKMMAVTWEEARELYALSRDKGVFYTVSPDTFLGAGAQTTRKLIDSGLIGDVVGFSASVVRCYQCCFEDKGINPPHIMQAGGGIPYDMGGYYLHNIVNTLGPIDSVCGFSATKDACRAYVNPRHPLYGTTFSYDTPNILTAAIRMKNGALGTLTCVSESVNAKPFLVYYGTEGAVYMHDPNDFSGEILLERKDCAPVPFPLTHGYRENARGLGVADMAWAIRRNRSPRADAALGLHAFEAVHGICVSMETERLYHMSTTLNRPAPLPSGHTQWTAQERALDC